MLHTVRHLRIQGRVQGVYYRQSMANEALRLGITGWVRNRLDSSVEAVVSGSPEQVDAIITWAKRGPAAAVVTEVVVSEAEGTYSRFDRLPTA